MKLYPFQEKGVRFLARRNRAYLADKMGLGKTVQAIRAAAEVGSSSTLVLAPASVLENWRILWKEWGGPPGMEVMSYAKAVYDGAVPFIPDTIILDEAHYTKTPSAQRTKLALSAAQRANRAWLLSGTPMPNDPRELYTAFRYLWPERLPLDADGRPVNAFGWMERFCQWRPTTYGPKVYGVKNGSVLREMLFADTFTQDAIMLRRRLEDTEVGRDLPPLRITVQYLENDPGFTATLRTLEKKRKGDISTPETRRLLGAHKLVPVVGVIHEELQDRAYDKIVVMYHHREVGATLRESLRHHGVAGFGGDTPSGKRQAEVERFRDDPETRVFVVQQQAGGVGLDGLQVANEIILLEPDWSPEVNAQAIARIHRIGQGRPTRARLFAVAGTLDAQIMKTLTDKIQMRKEIVG